MNGAGSRLAQAIHAGRGLADPAATAPLSTVRKWLITFSVMLVTVMQILDTSVTNVALPHMQGSLSAGVEEMSWVLTSFLAANAIIIPATGWLSGLLGRRRFFLICTVLFTVSSFLSGIAPNLTSLVLARVFQGLGGGPVIPISQAILWEMFPLHQRGMAMALWGVGIMLGPILGPTVGGWITDNWSWRWIFYINLPIGLFGFLMASAFVSDSPYTKKPGRVDVLGLVLMVIGFGCLQLTLDWGEREDWFDSRLITGLAVVAACAIVGFVFRELTCAEPILDLSVFNDRNFAIASVVISLSVFAFYASMLLLALYTQKLLAYDAWTSGLVLAPGAGQHAVAARRGPARHPGGPADAARHRLPHQRRRAHADVEHDDRHGLLEPRLAALRPGPWHGIRLRSAADARPRDGAHGAARERDRGLQRGAERGRERGRRARHDAPRAPEPGPPDHARRPRQHLECRDGRAPQRARRAVRRAGHRHVHRRTPGALDPLRRPRQPGARARVCRRVLALVDDLFRAPRDPPLHAARADRAREAARGGSRGARRGAADADGLVNVGGSDRRSPQLPPPVTRGGLVYEPVAPAEPELEARSGRACEVAPFDALALQAGRDLVEVLLQVLDLGAPVLDRDPHEVTDRQHREQPLAAHDGQMADVRLIHLAHRGLVVLVGVGHDEPDRHHLSDRGAGRVEAAVDDLLDDVALGEDPDEPVPLQHRHDADVVRRHRARRLGDRRAALDREEEPVTHDVAQLLHWRTLPRFWAGGGP